VQAGRTHAADGERIDLRISLASVSDEQDVIVRASGTDPVSALAQAAARQLETSAQQGVWCERRSEQLDPECTLRASGIEWGDRLRLMPSRGEPTHVGGVARFELVVTSGPCAGERFQLGDGSHRLGRDPSLELVLDDPSLSRHHLDLRVEPTGISVADAGSRNGTAIGGDTLHPRVFLTLNEDQDIEVGRSLLRMRSLGEQPEHRPQAHGGRIDFTRQPRVSSTREPFRRTLKGPPSHGRKARLPLAASLLPLGAGVLLFLLLDSPVMLAIAGLSPLMAIATYLSDRRGGKRSFSREVTEFRARLQEALKDLDVALEKETEARRAESPDAPALTARLRALAPTLWERGADNADFLRLRVGLADLPAQSAVEIENGGDPGIRAQAEREIAMRETVHAVPLTLDVAELGVVGLTGSPERVAGLARWLLVQAAVLHSPGELSILAALSPTQAKSWSWLKWLPHLRPDRVGLQVPAVTTGREQAEKLLGEIAELARRRAAQSRAGTGPRPAQLLLLIDEAAGADRALVTAALTGVAEHGIAVLWLGRSRRDLPGQVSAIVDIDEDRAALTLTEVEGGRQVKDASVDALAVSSAEHAARLLAPIRDVGELARAGDIPARVGLLELLGLLPIRADSLAERWREWRGGLKATVGVEPGGALTLDLPSEGPHALIAGTTGSGKSELLRTFVAAAAANAPPDRLSFLLVDYKGGAAFAPCAALPHVADIVSDLDEHLAERALISLEAELKRRERVLAERGAKDLAEMLRRDPDAAPPLLVIAVDEFAKLREEVPEFVDGVVDIAQRGRSLGVHMVLAAQTLRNAFTPAIRANTNLRLALRVAEESESEDMIASPLAARIPSGERARGRAFARTGHGELREFQTAYVSGRSEPEDLQELRIDRYEIDGPSGLGEDLMPHTDSDADSDLVALGRAAREAHAQLGLSIPPRPWLPTLPEVLDLERVKAESREAVAVIGLVDLPHLQRQDPLAIDLAGTGHIAVFGASNSGKTTALTSLALALASSTSPDRLHIYGLDAASGALGDLEVLPHCGAVLTVDEEERVQRLLRALVRRIEHGSGARAANETGSTAEEARVVVLLDDLGSFARHYDRPGLDSPYEQLQKVLAGGRAAGVHIALTASRRGDLPAALAAHVGSRLILRMTTEEDMLSLGLDGKRIRGAQLPIGRGFTQDTQEFQIAVPTIDGERMPLAQATATLLETTASRAPEIGVLPTKVARESLAVSPKLDRVPLGIDDEGLSPATVDLSELHLLVIGPYRSGRSTALETLLHGLGEAEPAAAFHLLAPRRSPLGEFEAWASVAAGADACADSAANLLERQEAGEFEHSPTFVFIDDGGELTEAKATHHLERLIRTARGSSLRVLAAVETGSARGIGNSWIRELRREGHGILLQPDLAGDGDLLATALPRRVPTSFSPGRGYLVTRGAARLVQIAS